MLRFGLDIGIASVGWAVVDDDYRVLESGSNIFEAADAEKNGNRREFRQHKRLLRRKRTRLQDFDRLWQSVAGNVPNGQCNIQLELRNKGLSEQLSEEEFYYVLKNMLTHRGISYLDDAIDDSNAAKSDYARGIQRNREELKRKLPCQIQRERLEKYGRYRGEIEVSEDDEKIVLSNIFTISAYKKELRELFKKQKDFLNFIDETFEENYMKIFSRKREYYVGPGNDKSRTDYGKYTTKINPETGEYITEENIFEKLIGKCSVYPEEMRAAGASYTAQEFNLLNDLNDLVINERKLSKEEKQEIVRKVKTVKSVNMEKIIRGVIGEEIETMAGYRIDKNGKKLFHKFDTYNKIRREFEKSGLDISLLTVEDLDRLGNILTLNTERDAIVSAIKREGICLDEEMQNALLSIKKSNGSLFSKWQSFSLRIMGELIPEMYEQPKNQMQLLTDMGVMRSKKERYQGVNTLSAELLNEDIYNPVVARSVRIATKVINALIKKYGYPKEIVIEMPRDRNSEEEKKRIADTQKNNEKELKEIIDRIKKEYGIAITEEHFHRHRRLALKLKLWNEQNGCCLYSGKPIEIMDLLNDQSKFEIDHVIPRSISFDDSRANKVLVYHTENQLKGNTTPYMYLNDDSRKWSFHEYMSNVLDLYDKKRISDRKKNTLLYREDITKIDVMRGFISRNINDTRYASRVILNGLQGFLEAKGAGTKVKVIRGSFTHQMRSSLKLDKDREKSFSHHAVDAMLICFSQMGYESYHKLQEEFIDFDGEAITDRRKWEARMDDKTYEDYLYQNKWRTVKENILRAEKEVKFWHRVDRKANRALCNQTIRGTRTIDGKTMKINKLDIYSVNGYRTFKKMLEGGKEDRFLMYRNDRRTWEDLLAVFEEYKDANNAFQSYRTETGDCVRKYAKNRQGAPIVVLKYQDGEVGSCIDISHKYGHAAGSQKVILESTNPYRTDVYYQEDKGKYFLVGIKYCDCCYRKGKYVIEEEAYRQRLIAERVIEKSQSRADLERLGIIYQFSLYKNDLLEYEKNGQCYVERFLSRTMPQNMNYIETKPVDRAKFEKQHPVGLAKTTRILKIRTDILGNRYYCSREKFSLEVDRV